MVIRAAHLKTLLEESAHSPEDFAAIMGLSGMTLRRWMTIDEKAEAMPATYLPQLREALYRLIADGTISHESKLVKTIIGESMPLHLQASIKALCGDMQAKDIQDETGWLEALHKIGGRPQHVKAVEQTTQRSWKKFFGLGPAKKERIETLLDVVGDRKTPTFGKGVAYGALFYLLTPFDLIPDYIAGLGFLDDLGALEVAVSYYVNHMKAPKA